MPENYKITQDAVCTLPIGITRDGVTYREVVIDKWRAMDKDRLTEPAARQNPGKAMTIILQRIIQSITGLVEAKSSHKNLIPERYVTEMFVADRDYLVLQALALSNQCVRTVDFQCQNRRCGKELTEEVDIREIEVTPQDPEKDTFVEFELPDEGVRWKDKEGVEVTTRKGKFNYPRGLDQEKVSKYTDEGTFSTFTRMLIQCISEFGDLKHLSMNDAKNLTLEDRNYLENLLGNESPGPDQSVKVTCPYCGKEQTVSIELGNFFL